MQLARRSVLDTTLTTLPSLTLACSEDDCIFERRRKFERLGRTLTVDQDFAGSRSSMTASAGRPRACISSRTRSAWDEKPRPFLVLTPSFSAGE